MRVECQKNEKKMEIENFTDNDFQKVEEYFYQEYFQSKYIDRRGFYEYVDIMKQSGKTYGCIMESDFPISIYIYLS